MPAQPFCRHALSTPTKTWLQRVSSDPEAQVWGVWSWTEKTPLKPEGGKVEDDEEDTGFPRFYWTGRTCLRTWMSTQYRTRSFSVAQVHMAFPFHLEKPPELEAIKLKLWAMEQAQGPELPRVQGQAGKEEAARSVLAQQRLSPETEPGPPLPCSGVPEKVGMDHRPIYVGNVDYGVIAGELEAYFNICGEVQQVTILCNKFSGHPKGYAYIEFATESSAQAAVGLDKSIFQGRVIKVCEPHESPGHLEVGALGCMDSL
ncbi:PREDICTED: embryonic polyadenylate-binding protein 2 [Myotis davidii]|uniref:embryonic polyadenylate-binding protein 2 n=1 Tax=Myotis davidii TaxID=225400 RepID=UPI0007673AD8|nr:PREDICTED: embryonic polyadenylate-binding protein 2 [Myotis davidii]